MTGDFRLEVLEGAGHWLQQERPDEVNRALLGPGLPGRPWFRHEIYAPGLNTGYAGVPLPRIGQAVLDKDRAAYRAGVETRLRQAETARAEAVARATGDRVARGAQQVDGTDQRCQARLAHVRR